MDEKLLNGLYTWIDSLKEEYKKISEITELAVLEIRKEIAEESVDRIKESLSRENFYNKFIKETDEEINRVKLEYDELRTQRKELYSHVAVLEDTIQRSSYRRELQ